MTISAINDKHGNISNYVAVFTDISAIKHSEAKLDPLTDLPNRLVINDRIDHAIQRYSRTGQEVAILFLDLDRFKNVNDTLGHPCGDELLIKVAQRLKEVLRQGDTIGRLGGEEFIVIIENFSYIKEIERIADKLLRTMVDPFSINGRELYLGVSICISLYPNNGGDAATLIRNADTAMYRAKVQGRNNYQFYTSNLTAEATERLALESALRHALERDELFLHYQPKIDLVSNKIFGAEALLSWHHHELGFVSPDKFIPLAEETGLILPIGEWVLKTTCQDAAQWIEGGLAINHISVNISGIQIQRGDLVNLIKSTLVQTKLIPECLELEVTESILMNQPEVVINVLDRLRELGVGLAVDDFGTGYSSLSYLKRFPLSCLKIDRAFIHDLPDDKNDMAITNAVIALDQSLQLSVVAEGVENKEQQDYLISKGCGLAQGFFFSRALPNTDFIQYVLDFDKTN